ncbi:MAG: transcriptional regulator [Pseudomonadota bacterium]
MSNNPPSGRFAYDGLDRTIHERARLSILTSLMCHPKGLSFVDMKKLCDLTDGNLSRHVKVLVDAGFVSVAKGYEENRPHTHCKITKVGQKQFLDYVSVLQQVVKDAANEKKRVRSAPLKSSIM